MVLAALFLVMNSGISASLPSNCVPAMMEDFQIQGRGQKVLPTAIFLIGYVVGPLVLSPLSETIGRRPVLSWTLTVFVLGTLACALAPTWPSLLVFRLVCGLAGAAPQTVVGGLYADLFADQRTRGRVMAFYMAVCYALHICTGLFGVNFQTGLQLWTHYWPDHLRVCRPVRLEVDVPY